MALFQRRRGVGSGWRFAKEARLVPCAPFPLVKIRLTSLRSFDGRDGLSSCKRA